jgi:hypothetical protein
MRQIIANHLHVDYSKAKPESTMDALGCSKPEFLELIQVVQKHFPEVSSLKDDPRLSGNDDSWKSIRIVDLADIVRPEWNKTEKGTEKGDITDK